ncbi:DUF362 domain-containing protein [candidate division KSB3 bacterium]|uniref:DUF362 domain-containing protein n=1 Tax=candidate division KSB3 bacterium TaxID=2044937 RepID=A0A9D5Q5V2_9BACT|nr:DUF362 domain-containing protein [candidate division KSB3 bacterium]MBD3324627.1 DUF362 domain-containing protein [candidate division KSB3 bacterium]
MKAKVAVLYTTPATILQDYARLLELADVTTALESHTETILKDNISWHYPFPGANTTPWQLEGTILALKNAGFHNLTCVQNKTVVINTFKGEDLNLYMPIFRQYDIPVRYNFKHDDMTWIPYTPRGEMLVLDQIFPDHIIRIPDYFIGKNIVHLPTVKCHIYTTTTGAMKNAFGGLLSTYRHYTHTWIHETLVDLLTIQREIHPGLFAVMDGTTAGNGPGPRTMDPQIKNVILASADQVAIDAVAAKLMGIDPLSIGYIRLAHDRGLGVGDVNSIDVVGDDIRGVNWHFSVGRSFHKFLGWLAWYGPTKALQKLIFRTPLVIVPILVSEINHDYIHWPLVDRRKYLQWRRDTSWGQLFDRYAKTGYLRQ